MASGSLAKDFLSQLSIIVEDGEKPDKITNYFGRKKSQTNVLTFSKSTRDIVKLSYDLMFSMERSEKVFNSTILQILQSKKGLSIFIDIFFTIFNLDRKTFSE